MNLNDASSSWRIDKTIRSLLGLIKSAQRTRRISGTHWSAVTLQFVGCYVAGIVYVTGGIDGHSIIIFTMKSFVVPLGVGEECNI